VVGAARTACPISPSISIKDELPTLQRGIGPVPKSHPMLSSLQNLLTSFFQPDESEAAQGGNNLPLATAVLLFDVMRSDDNTNDAERTQALTSLRQRFALSKEAAAQLMAQAEQIAVRANDYFSFTSLMNERFTQAQKIQVIEFMWQVAYADGTLDAHENHVISKVAGLLHVTHGEYIGAKMHAKEAAQLSAVQVPAA
jgi:uncharacterized tellurite resistance protein B-like protein